MVVDDDRPAQVRRRHRHLDFWWSDRNGRWERYCHVDATPDIDEQLQEIYEDPTAIFWG